MEYRQLGKDGPKVSAIAMGCFAFGGDKKTGKVHGRPSLSLPRLRPPGRLFSSSSFFQGGTVNVYSSYGGLRSAY